MDHAGTGPRPIARAAVDAWADITVRLDLPSRLLAPADRRRVEETSETADTVGL